MERYISTEHGSLAALDIEMRLHRNDFTVRVIRALGLRPLIRRNLLVLALWASEKALILSSDC